MQAFTQLSCDSRDLASFEPFASEGRNQGLSGASRGKAVRTGLQIFARGLASLAPLAVNGGSTVWRWEQYCIVVMRMLSSETPCPCRTPPLAPAGVMSSPDKA